MSDHTPRDADEADWAEQHHEDADRSRLEPSVDEASAETRPAPSEAEEDIESSEDDWPRTEE